MRIIEQLVRSAQGPPEFSEDLILVGDRHVAVIDGAPVFGSAANTEVAGRLAASAVAGAIDRLAVDTDVRTALDLINESLRALHEGGLPLPADRPAATAVVMSVHRREVWRIGDCQYIVNGRRCSPRNAVEAATAACRAAYLEAAVLKGMTVQELRRRDLGRAFVLPLIADFAYFRNADPSLPWSFGALDGSPVPDGFIEIAKVPPKETEVVLASDGYPELDCTLERSEATLREQITHDPLFFRRFLALKGVEFGAESFDDRAYIRLQI